jgi:hypothetical protein
MKTRVLRKIFGPKEGEVSGQFTILYDKVLRNLQSHCYHRNYAKKLKLNIL